MSTLGSRLLEERKRIGLSQVSFAERGRVGKHSQINYEADRRSPDGNYLKAISDAGADITYILTGVRIPNELRRIAEGAQGLVDKVIGRDFDPIPRYDVFLAAGSGSLNDESTPVEHLAFSKAWLTRMKIEPGMAALLSVKGESMQPSLFEGDLVLVDRNRFAVQSGKLYAFVDGNDGARVKRLRLFGSAGLVIQSDNPSNEFADEERSGQDMQDVLDNIIGEVVWSGHTWS